MKVNVEYLANFRLITGKNREEIRLNEGCSLDELVKKLNSMYGREFCRTLLDPEGNLKPYMMLIVNNREIYPSMQIKLRDIKLKDGDSVAFLPPLSGG